MTSTSRSLRSRGLRVFLASLGLAAGVGGPAAAIAGASTASPSSTDAASAPVDGRGHRPPPEALQACASLGAGASCAFTTPRGDAVTGRCGAPEGLPLACRPKNAPPPDGGASAPTGR